jgi:hypothetical protein
MNEKNDNFLVEKYPKIFKLRHSSPQESAMCYGFCHGDGWFEILNKACGLIQHHIDLMPEEEREAKQVVAVQVKEKFGELRFYASGGDAYTSGVLDMASYMSQVTCEECGSPGKIEGPGWYRCLCVVCKNKRNEQK